MIKKSIKKLICPGDCIDKHPNSINGKYDLFKLALNRCIEMESGSNSFLNTYTAEKMFGKPSFISNFDRSIAEIYLGILPSREQPNAQNLQSQQKYQINQTKSELLFDQNLDDKDLMDSVSKGTSNKTLSSSIDNLFQDPDLMTFKDPNDDIENLNDQNKPSEDDESFVDYSLTERGIFDQSSSSKEDEIDSDEDSKK